MQTLCRNPRAKARHEVVDYKMYTKRSNKDYVDFRQDRRVLCCVAVLCYCTGYSCSSCPQTGSLHAG